MSHAVAEGVCAPSPTTPTLHPAVAAHANSNSSATASDKNNEMTAKDNNNNDNNDKSSSAVHSPSVNEDAHRTTYEELDELYDGMLQRLRQLQQLRERGRAVTRRELAALRKAYRFAEEEKHILDEQHAARQARRQERQQRQQQRGDDGEEEEASERSTSVLHAAVAPAVTEEGEDDDNNNKDKDNNNDDTMTAAKSRGGDDEDSNSSSSSSSNGSSEDYAFEPGIAPKTVEAQRLLCALETYVQSSPLASTAEDDDGHRALWSWRSLLHTPSERRLQSLVVSLFNFFTMLPLCMVLTVVLLCCSRYTAVMMLAYLLYMFTVGRVRHPLPRNERVTRWWLWRYYSDYFPVSLVLPRRVRRRFHASRNYFFVYHPHGVHSFGALTVFGLDTQDLARRLPGIHTHLQTLGVNFRVPFWRSLMCALGAGDASAACLRATLRSGPGQSVVVVVGGAAEALLAKPHTNNIVLGTRKGFVRIALQEGSPLVPVYAFGENDAYDILSVGTTVWFMRLQQLVKRVVGFAMPAFAGRGYFTHRFGLMPHRRPIVVVVGAPIELPRLPEPTAAEVDAWHDRYVAELRKLYNSHCGIFDLDSTGLRITR